MSERFMLSISLEIDSKLFKCFGMNELVVNMY